MVEWITLAKVLPGNDSSYYSLLSLFGFQHNRNLIPSRQVWKFRLPTELSPMPSSQGVQAPYCILIPQCDLSVKPDQSRIANNPKYLCFVRLMLSLASPAFKSKHSLKVIILLLSISVLLGFWHLQLVSEVSGE